VPPTIKNLRDGFERFGFEFITAVDDSLDILSFIA